MRQGLRRSSGFSLLELVVSILIISVLMALGYNKLEQMAEDVERVSFTGARDNIQAQLTLKVAYWYAEQRSVTAKALKRVNPIELIQHKPSNYAGEIEFNELQSAKPERWYFVIDKRWLVYKAKRTDSLENEFERGDIVPFQIQVRFNPAEQKQGLAVEARLKALYAFKWRSN